MDICINKFIHNANTQANVSTYIIVGMCINITHNVLYIENKERGRKIWPETRDEKDNLNVRDFRQKRL